MTVVKLILFALLLSAGQILFKQVAIGIKAEDTLNILKEIILSPWLYGALLLYGSATLLWIVILKDTPLSYAYPYVAVGFIIIPVAAWFLFAETLSLRYALGTLLIVAGILLTSVK